MDNGKTKQETLQHMRDSIIDNAERAVRTMEHFIQTARRAIADARENPEAKDFRGHLRVMDLPQCVLHQLSWGLANASGGIEDAMSDVNYYNQIEKS